MTKIIALQRSKLFLNQTRTKEYVKDKFAEVTQGFKDRFNKGEKCPSFLVTGLQTDLFNLLWDLIDKHYMYGDIVKEKFPALFRISYTITERASYPGIATYVSFTEDNPEWLVFSWQKCCEITQADGVGHISKFARSIIASQISIYIEKRKADGTYLECDHCKSRGPVQVDHIFEFHKILAIFKEEQHIKDVFDLEQKEDEWKNFHKAHATLQTLCNDCHLSKSTGGTTEITVAPKRKRLLQKK